MRDFRTEDAECAAYLDAADWCAAHGPWALGDPLPADLHPDTLAAINVDPEDFAERVRDAREALTAAD